MLIKEKIPLHPGDGTWVLGVWWHMAVATKNVKQKQDSGMSDKRREPWIIQATVSEKFLVGGGQGCPIQLCRLYTAQFQGAPSLTCTLITKVFQQMALQCLVPYPNLHKVLFGLVRVLVTGPVSLGWSLIAR